MPSPRTPSQLTLALEEPALPATGGARTRAVLEESADARSIGSSGEVRSRGPRLFVLPDAARVEERLLLLARASGLVAGKAACSLAELERELFRAARLSVASPLALSLALREAARQHSPGPYFAIREQPGYARALGDLLAALSHGLLDPAELSQLDVPLRVRALGKTLVAVRSTLGSAGLVDAGRGLSLAVESLERGGPLPAFVAQASELEFDGILDWTPLRLRLAAALSRRLRVKIRLPFSDKPELNEALDPTLRALERLGDGPAPEVVLHDPAQGMLGPFLRRLFAAQGEVADAPVELVSCASPLAQAREVARQCAELLRGGAAPESIGIAARSLSRGIAEELAAALERAGIPWRERRGRPALPAAPVRLALSLYDLIERDFPREPLIDLLSTRLLWLQKDGERLPAQALARTLREAHLRDDAQDGIARRLDALALRSKAPPGELEEARVRTLRAVAELRQLPAQATLREHGAALLGLLVRWGLLRKLRTPEPPHAGPALSRAADLALARDQAALRALEDTCAGLARAAAQLGFAELRLSRAAYAQILAGALADASLPPGGARGGAVQLVELREVPGRSFQHLFIVGLVEGELPAPPAVDPLLSEEERRSVNRAARRAVFRLPAQAGDAALLPSRQAEEPLLFHLALCSAAESARLLWPRADAQGRESLRSPFADEAARALRKPVRQVPLAPIPSARDCAGPAELLARAALDAFAEPAFRVSPPAPAAQARELLAAVARSSLRGRLSRISRAAQAERERVRVFIREQPPGRFSGQLSGAAQKIAAQAFAFGVDAPASAHQLEEHATCGFRTLAHRLLRVSRDESDDEELGARERGTLFHHCLEKFFRALRGPLRGTPEELQLLRDTAEAEMAAFERERHVGNPALWALRRESLVHDLWAIAMGDLGEPLPLEVERRFGFDEPGSWLPLELIPRDGGPGLYVRGAIDRVDRRDGVLLAVDYKSSRLDVLRRKLKAETLLSPELQLALYAALLRQREPLALVDAQYISMKEAARTPTLRKTAKLDVDALLELDPARRALLQDKPNLADAVHAQAALMRSGRFEVRPLSCDFCELKPACRLVALPTDPDENGGEVSRAW
jgi:ATP-dependent helicase/nuclease subunit B